MIDPTQFLSTYAEWHYFVAGISLGFVKGWAGHAIFHHVHSRNH